MLLAESIRTGDGSPKRTGDTLLLSTSKLNAADLPGTPERWNVTITNTGQSAQAVGLLGRTLGPTLSTQTGSVTLTDGVSPQFANYQGLQNNYGVFTFEVPVLAQRLSASLAWPGNPTYCLQDACEVGLNLSRAPDPDRSARALCCAFTAPGTGLAT